VQQKPSSPLTGNRRRLLRELRVIARDLSGDPEAAHGLADNAILEYLHDPLIKKYYDAVPKWYA
jgi:hypothetical protein